MDRYELKYRISKEINDTEKSIEGILLSLTTFLIASNGFFLTTENIKILILWQKLVLLISIILLSSSLILGMTHLIKLLQMYEKSLRNWTKEHHVDRWPYFNLQIYCLGLVLLIYSVLIISILFRKTVI